MYIKSILNSFPPYKFKIVIPISSQMKLRQLSVLLLYLPLLRKVKTLYKCFKYFFLLQGISYEQITGLDGFKIIFLNMHEMYICTQIWALLFASCPTSIFDILQSLYPSAICHFLVPNLTFLQMSTERKIALGFC